MSFYSDVEAIAANVEDWGDGWRFLFNPDDRGTRARLCRAYSPTLDFEIEIAEHDGEYFVHIAGHNRGSDGQWTTVSASVRNPLNRKAIDYINERLDALDAARSHGAEGEAE
jgi:hypothetical protein